MVKAAVLAVLERAAEDVGFFCQLAEHSDVALEGYELTSPERLALALGDLPWIESHLEAKLDERLVSRVLVPLLSRELW